MKSLAELAELREKLKADVNLRRDGTDDIRVLVGMATCGIAAGARAVISEVTAELARRELEHVTVAQTGCIGMCKLEPIVDVFVPGHEKVTYVLVTPDKIPKIIGEHVVNGRPVVEYTVGAYEKD